jgi:hypothetical protein
MSRPASLQHHRLSTVDEEPATERRQRRIDPLEDSTISGPIVTLRRWATAYVGMAGPGISTWAHWQSAQHGRRKLPPPEGTISHHLSAANAVAERNVFMGRSFLPSQLVRSWLLLSRAR